MSSGYRPRQVQRISSGLCHKCGLPRGANGTGTACRPCADASVARVSARRRAKQDSGTCACGNPRDSPDKLSCIECREYAGMVRSDNYYKWKSEGRCVQCGEESLRHSRRCLHHYLALVCTSHGWLGSQWESLRTILDAQGGKCYYTGEALELGLNADLDHKKPKSRFPELIGDFSNVVFCHERINAWKADRTDEEFISNCLAIAKAHGGLS